LIQVRREDVRSGKVGTGAAAAAADVEDDEEEDT